MCLSVCVSVCVIKESSYLTLPVTILYEDSNRSYRSYALLVVRLVGPCVVGTARTAVLATVPFVVLVIAAAAAAGAAVMMIVV